VLDLLELVFSRVADAVHREDDDQRHAEDGSNASDHDGGDRTPADPRAGSGKRNGGVTYVGTLGDGRSLCALERGAAMRASRDLVG